MNQTNGRNTRGTKCVLLIQGIIVSSSFTIPALRLFIHVRSLFMNINTLATTTYSGYIPLYPRPSRPLETSPASDATRLRVSAGPAPCHHFFDLAGPAGQRLSASSPLVACFQRETCKCNHTRDFYLGLSHNLERAHTAPTFARANSLSPLERPPGAPP
jgi:hypothetical protein